MYGSCTGVGPFGRKVEIVLLAVLAAGGVIVWLALHTDPVEDELMGKWALVSHQWLVPTPDGRAAYTTPKQVVQWVSPVYVNRYDRERGMARLTYEVVETDRRQWSLEWCARTPGGNRTYSRVRISSRGKQLEESVRSGPGGAFRERLIWRKIGDEIEPPFSGQLPPGALGAPGG